MSLLSYVTRVTAPNAVDRSHISDLALIDVAGQTRLYATTLFDGVITSWNINGTTPTLLDMVDYQGGLAAGRTGSLMQLQAGSDAILLTGGSAAGGLVTHDLTSGGDITTNAPLSSTNSDVAGLSHAVTISLGDQQFVYGGLAGGSGLGRLRFDAAGNLTGKGTTPDTTATYADAVSDTAHLRLGGQDYIYSASSTEHGITTWVVTGNGGLSAGPGLGMNEGLWIAAPTALATTTVGGTSYLLVGAATSNSLSVMRADPDGSLHVTDHVMDTRDTRFGGVQAVEIVTLGDRAYVISGGADDGVAVHVLLPNGQLVHLDSFADTNAAGLQNVSALTARANGNTIDIFAASASENGITRLKFETGGAGLTLTAPAGGGTLTGGNGLDVLSGGAGNDRLFGGGGIDVLRDGAGSDTMTGGTGADIFVLAYDNAPDVITDFQVGVDRLDLSGWPMVRSKSQLTLTITATGFRVTYGDEVLDVHSSHGGPIDHRNLTTTDLIGGARIDQVILPGFAGPYTPPPTIPDAGIDLTGNGSGGGGPDIWGGSGGGSVGSNYTPPGLSIAGQYYRNPVLGSIGGQKLQGGNRADTLSGSNRNDLIRGGRGDDRLAGNGGTDRLYGDNGTDRLAGSSGDDRLDGGRGHDRLYGGKNDDLMIGGSGNDRIYGETGDDLIYGGSGNDRIYGGSSHDRLYGGAGSNSLYGSSGNDVLGGAAGRDMIRGGDGRDLIRGNGNLDRLSGDGGNDDIGGGSGGDRLYGGSGRDKLKGDSGNDRIYGGTGSDVIDGGRDRDIGRGGTGDDRLYGGSHDDTLSGDNGRDLLQGGTGRDRLFGGNQNDRLFGGSGADQIRGGRGNDQISGDSNIDRLWGEAGNDRMFGGSANDQMFGGANNDIMRGGTGNDRMSGDGGNDTLWGDVGSDTLRGQDGRDLLVGGSGFDRLEGGTGNDRLLGDADNDLLKGQDGNDLLRGGAGRDRLEGGTGADQLWGDAGDDSLLAGDGWDTLFGNDGNDAMFGGNQGDQLFGGNGADLLSGGADNDALYGGVDADVLQGDTGDDLLFGDAGTDTLFGGDGSDILAGGAGDDDLSGGLGTDTFVFDDGHDRIVDFEQGTDLIQIDYDLFAGTLVGSEILLLYGSYDGSTATIDFANGHVLTIDNVTDYGTFADSLVIV